MKARTLAVISMLALAACGGGGGGGSTSPPAGGAPPAPTTAPQGSGSFAMAIGIPKRAPSAAGRQPRYVSPGTASLAFYDGTTLIYVANLSIDSSQQFTTVYSKSGPTSVAPGSCTDNNTTEVCTLTVTAPIGAHKFDLIAYGHSQGATPAPSSIGRRPSDVGTPPTFQGVITSEGELSVTLSPGANPGATLTMLGVADTVAYSGVNTAAYNATSTFGFRIEDAASSQILTPGDYDNGPITITAAPSGIVTITPNSFTTPPATLGDQSFDVKCVNSSGGAVTISFNAKTQPNTAYASGLTHSTANYSPAVIQTIAFTCDPASATIPITVDGKGRQ